jgi:WD40 repeat protein
MFEIMNGEGTTMSHRQSRRSKTGVSILVWLLLLSHAKPSDSAQTLGRLHLDKTLQWDQKYAGPFAFAPDGRIVAACGMAWGDDFSLPGALRLWSVNSGERLLDLSFPGVKIVSIAFSHDGQRLFSGSLDGVVRIHDLRSSKSEIIPDALGQDVMISPDGTMLAASAGQMVQMINVASKQITAKKELEDAWDIDTCPMAFSPNGKVIAVARADRNRVKVHEIELCDPRTLHSIAVLRADAAAVQTLSYSPDGALLAAGGNDGTVVIWDVNALNQRRKVNAFTDPNAKGYTHVAFSPDGKLLGVGGTGLAVLLDVETLAVVEKIKGVGVFVLEFSTGGKLLLTSSSSYMHPREIKLWRVGKP